MNLKEQNPVLAEILGNECTRTPSGESIPLQSFIDFQTAEALYQFVLKQKPSLVVEIGMANAISSMAILTALRDSGGQGRLISIDPNQSSQWKNCGRAAVSRAGLSDLHEIIEQPDWLALPKLLDQGKRIHFGYIDGWHTFDYALMDFWFLDKMLEPGGTVAFNDCGWPAVTKAIQFVLTHRRYREIDAGLPPRYQRPTDLMDILRRARYGRLGDFWRQQQDRYFMKMENWEPSWDFYAPF